MVFIQKSMPPILQKMTPTSEIIEFIKGETDANANVDTDIERDLGVFGDDFYELMEAFAKRYNVDMSEFIWYFHSGEEGLNIPSAMFFKPPYARVARIPVTPLMLSEFANTGKWSIDYPSHDIPKKRFDLTVNFLFIVMVAGLTLYLSFLAYYSK